MHNTIQQLLQKEKGLVFLSAPSKGGKSKLVKAIKNKKPETVIISGEQFLTAVMQPLKTNGQTELLDTLGACNPLCIEDLDWYSGRTHTQYQFAKVLSCFAEKSIVIVTGIDLKQRLKPMFSSLQHYDYFEKTYPEDDWM